MQRIAVRLPTGPAHAAQRDFETQCSDWRLPSAAQAPKTLSRPTVATSTVCPSVRRTIIEITPL
jgi:hypothetical protein